MIEIPLRSQPKTFVKSDRPQNAISPQMPMSASSIAPDFVQPATSGVQARLIREAAIAQACAERFPR